jgi:hypothetical protein
LLMPGELEKLYLKNLGTRPIPTSPPGTGVGVDGGGSVSVNPLSTVMGDPIGALKGAVGIIPTMAKGIYQMGANAAQATPLGNIVRVPGSTLPENPSNSERIGALGNLATLGMSGMVGAAWDKSGGQLDEFGKQIAKTIIPIDQVKSLITGTNPETGESLTSEQLGEQFSTALVSGLPLLGAAGKVVGALKKGVVAPTRTLITKSMMGGGDGPSATEILTDQLRLAGKGEKNLTNPPAGSQLPANQPLGGPISATDRPIPLKIRNPLDPADYLPTQEGILGSTEILKMIEDLRGNQATIPVADAMVKFSKDATFSRAKDQMVELVREGAMNPETMASLLKRNSIVPADAAAMSLMLGDALDKSATFFGKGLNAISQYKKSFNKAFADDPEALKMIGKVANHLNDESGIVTVYSKLSNMYRGWLKVARSSMVGQVATTMRNLSAQGANFGVNILDDAMTDTLTMMAGKVTGKGKNIPLSEYYSNTLTDFTTAYHMAAGKGRSLAELVKLTEKGGGPQFNQLYESILGEVPIEAAKLLGGPSNDVLIQTMLKDGPLQRLKGSVKKLVKGDTLSDRVDGWAETATFLNHSQEMEFRKLFFMGRLQQNATRFGYSSLDDFQSALKNSPQGLPDKYFGPELTAESFGQTIFPKMKELADQRKAAYLSKDIARGKELDSQLRPYEKAKKLFDQGVDPSEIVTKTPELANSLGGVVENAGVAVTDAIDHSLKQTFSLGAHKGTFPAAILKLYQDIPFMAGVGPYFPRFLINQWRWINDHNPLGLYGLVTKEFKDELMLAASNPKGMTRTQIEKVGKAMSGTVMWTAANYLRQSEVAGPKYYQLKVGKDEQGNDQLADLRAYQPFTSILFLEEAFKSAAEGKALNLNAAELNDAVTGMRRLSEVPLFAFTDVVRSIDSSSPGAFINSIKPFIGQALATPFVPLRSISDIGGAISPDMAKYKDIGGNELLGPIAENIPGVRNILPDRPDPFTGQPGRSENPLLRQATGLNIRSVSPMDKLILENNLSLGELLGNYGDPEADRIVSRNLGKLMSTKLGDSNINTQLANLIASQPPALRGELIRKVYSSLRSEVQTKSILENPAAFVEYFSRRIPEPFRESARKKLTQELPRRAAQP